MNNSASISFIPDEELTLQKKAEGVEGNDLLNTSTYVDALVDCVNNAPYNKTFTIGLFGEWGSGKSSIVKTAIDRIVNDAKEKREKVEAITYDSWKYSGDSFRRMFLHELRKNLGFEKSELMQRFYTSETRDTKVETKVSGRRIFIISIYAVLALIVIITAGALYGLKAIAPSAILMLSFGFSLYSFIFNTLKVSISKPLLFAPEQFEECYHEILSKAMKRHNWAQSILKWVTGGKYNKELSKLIIVIDNVDRCQPSVTYSLLSDIKTFLGDSQDVIFIVPVDVDALRKHIINNTKETSGQTQDADEFLRKIFNVSIWIKAFQNDEMYDFTQKLNLRYSLGLNPSSVSVISREYATNPRRIIQLLNNLSIELTHFDSDFRKEHESIICLIAIIREEYPKSYKEVVKNPMHLFNISKDSDSGCAYLLARTKAIVQKYENKLDVLDLILTNSAVPDYLTSEIRQALLTSDIALIKDYLSSDSSTPQDLKYRIMTCLWEDIRKSVERKVYLPDLYGYFCTLMGLNKAGFLNQSDYVQLSNLINDEETWNNLVSEVYLSQSSDLADFAVVLSENGHTSLTNAIISMIEKWEIKSEKTTEVQTAYIYNVCRKFYGKMITDKLVEVFRQIFEIYPDKAFEGMYRNPERFFTRDLVISVISQIKLEDVRSEQNPISRFRDICKHIQHKEDKLLSEYLKKMTAIMPEYNTNKSHNQEIIQVCSSVNEILEICKNVVFKEPAPLQNFINKCLKSVHVQVNYNRTELHNIYSDNTNNGEVLQELIRLVFNTQMHYTSMMLYDTNFVEFMLQNEHVGTSFCNTFEKLIAYRCPIEQYINQLKKYPVIDEPYRNILHYLYNDNATGKPRVEDSWIKDSLSNLVTIILTKGNAEVAKFLYDECNYSAHITKLLEEHLSKLSMSDLEQFLQTPLRAMAVDTFSRNIDSYQDNQNVLTLIAEHGDNDAINNLCKIIANKLTSGKITEGVSLINKLHICEPTDCNMLVGIIEALSDKTLGKDEKAELTERLGSVVMK